MDMIISISRCKRVMKLRMNMSWVTKRLSSGCCYAGRSMKDDDESARTWKIFSLKELQFATNNFSYENKLGEGGFGSVFYGQLGDKSEIAVKRLKVMNTTNEMSFAVEVETLGRLHHKNLLKLRGYCAEGEERLIVYDYMPNLSLLSHLHGHFSSDKLLDWRKRVEIAIGSAEGLAYLHHTANPHIIHRDVKASNILIDSNFQAQVADFGFAKFIPDGVTHLTTRVKGTLGYLAPEYAMWGKVSESCDVYSFGILLLELVTGRKPIEKIGPGKKRSIIQWAAPLVMERRFDELADPKLEGKYDGEELTRMIQVAALCAQNLPEHRPTMHEVVAMLKSRSIPEEGTIEGDLRKLRMEENENKQQLVKEVESDSEEKGPRRRRK
ncbi:PTI1-like tyrosine-protein kinase At3g15890 [Selaginella moellendorffii]|nr:PTI1-like tyrosine-protein kinase At3g15890 [Selaginella moellendorffii]|eukprot:XP_002980938.2 PTI1-like tyrosine-protein kinase At3g15890 [Selaginella moellendorffii]